ARDLPPEVRGHPRAVSRSADPPEERVRRRRRRGPRRLPEPAPGGLSAAAAGVVPRILQPRVQGEGDARVPRSRVPRRRADRVPPAPTGGRARVGHLALDRFWVLSSALSLS